MRSLAALPRRAAFAAPTRRTMSWSAIYMAGVFTIWTISPFLHRLSDWRTHYTAVSVYQALPILVLIPGAALFLTNRVRRVHRALEVVSLLWVFGFTYALIVSGLAGHLFGGIFTYVTFCLPLAFGLWVATCVEDTDVLYHRISQVAIILALVSGIYGIVQYVIVPPWDKTWMIDIQMNSIGFPLPFEVRVFSLLNSPATFGTFLVAAVIMFLPRLTLKSGLYLLPVFVGLALCMLRAGWITLPLSIFVFALLTTRRAQILKGLGVFVGAGLLLIVLSQTLLMAPSGSALTNRLLTLTDVAHDQSANDRAGQIAVALEMGLSDPEGSGLGAVGTSTRLNTAQQSVTNLDSGYLSRFVEMGVPGMSAFLASVAVAVVALARVWKTAVRNGDARMQDLSAMAISMQASTILMNFFGDTNVGLVAILSWVSLGLVLRSPAPKRVSL